MWEKNKGILVLVAPGLYQLTMGFYSNRTPTFIKVYVNGEIILTVKGSQQTSGANQANAPAT